MGHLINHLPRPIFVTNFDTVESFNNLDVLFYSASFLQYFPQFV